MKNMKVTIDTSWKRVLGEYFSTPEFITLAEFVKKEYQEKTIFPDPKNVFNAFNKTCFPMAINDLPPPLSGTG